MNFKFSNLLGAPYRGGNLLISGNELLTPVGNRVSQVCFSPNHGHALRFKYMLFSSSLNKFQHSL